ncbi:MAG: 23S rRNA (pseudouridine(1915)-N(3))-methyltransferase RlmH [Clostridium sp.]|nr:23S rRNA (pseudouridine(1915)-N(3))-methyltransferase RlmH [Clostridium sp.]
MIKIIAVGSLKEKYLKSMVEDYYKRITKYHKIELIEVKDSNITKEKDEILKKINKNDYIISLDIYGREYNSIEFKDHLENLFNNSKSNITFIIGGSDGIDDKIKSLSNELISFSKLTFPHGLFRAILLEQIYRSFKIMNNESYHK